MSAKTTDDETVITIRVPATITRKLAGHTFTFPVADIPAESLTALFTYGFRLPADAANSSAKSWRDANDHPTGTVWERDQSEAFFTAVMDGSIAERARSATGASTLDPVTELARRLAMTDITTRLDKTWKEMAADPRGRAYVIVTDKTIRRNDEAVDGYIDRALAKGTDYRSRAKAELDAKAAAVDADIDL